MNTPDLTTYRAVHHALRTSSAAMAGAATGLTAASSSTRRAYARYVRGFIGELHTHHTIEDDVYFPELVARVPVAAQLIERTDADHAHIDDVLAAVTASVAGVPRGVVDPALPGLVAELAEHLDAHLGFEDAEILPLYERHFTAEQYEALDRRAHESLKLGRQAAFTVPFVVSALPPEVRVQALATAPAPLRVTFHLTRRSHARLVRRAFGAVPVPTTGAAPSPEVAA